MPEAHANGIRLYYEARGEGAPIVCIHGGGSSALMCADAVEELARLGRVVAYDRRGCTRSKRPEPYERTSVAEQADDAAGLLDALAAAPAVVIGRSYGGAVAIELALRYPDRVRALALFPDEVRRILTQNGPALLAELRYVDEVMPDAAAFATIDKPTLLVAASESPPEQREMTEAMADALPDSRTALVAGGHLIDPAAPEGLAFVEELLERR